jgi:hypothetical protein
MISKKYLLGSVLPIIIGSLIYLCCRDNSIIIFRWLKVENLKNHLNVPDWFKYNLPDALWLVAFSYTLFSVWDFKIDKANIIWISLPLVISIVHEFGQFLKLFCGTFDPLDLLFYILSYGLSFLVSFSKNVIPQNG